MKVREILAQDQSLKTSFNTPLEGKGYLSILGAKPDENDSDSMTLDGLKCGVDREYQAIYMIDIPENVRKTLDKYGVGDDVYGDVVFNLETLVLIHMLLTGKNVERSYEKTLKETKRKMLARVMAEREPMEFPTPFNTFDQAVTPFLNEDFDPEKFLEECLFNTTGYYEKEGYDKCIKFSWRTKQNPDVLYAIEANKDGFHDTIMFKKCGEKFHQQVYHFAYNGDNKVKFFYGDTSLVFDPKTKTITESVHYKDKKRKATKFDAERVLAIMERFTEKSPAFERGKVNEKH